MQVGQLHRRLVYIQPFGKTVFEHFRRIMQQFLRPGDIGVDQGYLDSAYRQLVVDFVNIFPKRLFRHLLILTIIVKGALPGFQADEYLTVKQDLLKGNSGIGAVLRGKGEGYEFQLGLLDKSPRNHGDRDLEIIGKSAAGAYLR